MTILKAISEKITDGSPSVHTHEYKYCPIQNLNIDVITNKPLVDKVNLGTRTETRVGGEGSDSDADIGRSNAKLGTKTVTLTGSEGFDTDSDLYSQRLFVQTKTLTESQEITDSDK